MKAILDYLEKLTLFPDTVGPDDVAALQAAGISVQAINEATYICFLFNVIDRIADALNFKIPTSFKEGRSATILLRRGYRF